VTLTVAAILTATVLTASLTLAVGQTLTVEGHPVRVTFVEVASDSRCPTGVTCIWEGEAIVNLRVEREGGEPADLQLHAGGREPREAAIAGLRITLDRLEPHPHADRPIAPGDYRVFLSITAQ
jgi:hypothetical protein